MFQGRTFRIRHLSKNRYEYRDAYTVSYGTAGELITALSSQMQSAQRTAIELAAAKQQLKQLAATEGAPVTPPEPAKAVPCSAPKPAAEKEQSVHARAQDSKRSMPEGGDKPHRRRPNGLGYLHALREAEQAERPR